MYIQLHAPAPVPLILNRRLDVPQRRFGGFVEANSVFVLQGIETRFLGRLALSLQADTQTIASGSTIVNFIVVF
jgi:hypothetical protein